MKKRVGILTSGGDCPGLNATIRGAAKALYQRMGDKVEIVGIMNGYDGLIRGNYRDMDPCEFSGILTVGGTILGTKRTPFKKMRLVEDDKIDKVAAMKKTYKEAKLDCLLCLGGNGTHKTANLLSQEGLNIIGLPKTFNQVIPGFKDYWNVTGMTGSSPIYTTEPSRIQAYFDYVMSLPIVMADSGTLTRLMADESVRAMPCYPAEGFLAFYDGTLVVKLGDIAD